MTWKKLPENGGRTMPDNTPTAYAFGQASPLIADAQGVPRIALRSRAACIALGGISPRTLHQWTKDHVVPFAKINGVLLYPVAGLQDFLARRTTPPVTLPTPGPKSQDEEEIRT